jgi:hypothetical protein
MNASRSSPLTSLYVAGPLSMGYVDFYTFLIPLYGLSLGFDASEIGILVGARSILAMFLSIHIGVLNGSVRHAQSDLVLCVGRDGLGAAVSIGPVVLELAAAATDQRRRDFFCLVRRANADRSACRGRCPVSW